MNDNESNLAGRTPRALAVFRRRLLAWYDANARDLPWRRNPSPYKTLVSEFMLQQTQVKTVLPYFGEFLKSYPSMKALAASSEADVLRSWSGHGYYRRARALHSIAKSLDAEHRGRVPADPEVLRALPGFGDYTTAAVGSIAHGLPLAAVDGNVRRVLARVFAVEDAPNSKVWKALASEVLCTKRPGDWNQAMMELGATVCTPRGPKCGECHVSKRCDGLKLGLVHQLPKQDKLPATLHVREIAVAVVRRGKILVLRRAEGQPFAGMWDLPRSFLGQGGMKKGQRGREKKLSKTQRSGDCGAVGPDELLAQQTGLKAGDFVVVGSSRSTFTHHRIETEVHMTSGTVSGRLSKSAIRSSGFAEHQWVGVNALDELPTGAAQKRLFNLIRSHVDNGSKTA